MRILHTSDWHLGRNLEGRSRIPEQREFIGELCTILERENINLVLVAGDIFDTYNPSAEAEQLFYEALNLMSANGKRAVVVIAGNHDSPDRIQAANPISQRHGIYLIGYPGHSPGSDNVQGDARNEVASALQTTGNEDIVRLAAAGEGWFELVIPGCQANAVVITLPYPSEQRLNEIVSKSLEDQEMQRGYSERVAQVFEEASAHFRHDTVNLAVSHLFVLGGRSSESERDIILGGAYVVEPKKMPASAHYVALGHLHRPQVVGGTQVPCRYSGSPLCYSFSEADQQKEVVLVEAHPGEPPLVTPVKLTCGKQMRHLKFNSYIEAYNWCEEKVNANFWVDMEIDCVEPLDGSMVSALRKLHPGLINIRVILPGVPRDENEGQRVSELTLEEKFRRFAVRETGSYPEHELIELFLELAEGSDTSEAN